MTSAQEKFEAFVAFLESNKRGMIDSGVDKDVAMRAIERLADQGMSAERLVLRARHPHFGDELLQIVANKFQGGKRKEFLGALCSLSQVAWNLYFDQGVVGEFSATCVEFEHVMSQYKHVMLDGDHPMFERISADGYWRTRVQRYLARKDYQRAFDELKKALRGILLYKDGSEKGPKAYESGVYAYEISQEVLTQLVRETYDEMVTARLVEFVPDGEYKLENWYVRSTTYETKMTTRRRPMAHESLVELAGFEIAKWNFLVSAGTTKRWTGECETPYVFTREGGMVLRIAEWCRQKRNEKRRKKHEKIADDYKKLKDKK